MRGIGEVARASGLAVSALRFYDAAGVLVPAEVDAVTGYRRYSDEQVRAARLIAGLRRVGLPVAEIAEAVREMGEPAAVRRRLDRHRRRLEDGLADAKRALLRIHALLDLEENLMTRVTLPAAALAASLDAVRFAAADPAGLLPGVLFETGDGLLTLVATDRFRMALAEVAADVEGPPARVSLPLAFVERLRGLSGAVTLDLAESGVRAEAGGTVLDDKPLPVDFPDYRRLVEHGREPATRVTIDTARLRELVAAAPGTPREHEGHPYEIVIFGVDRDGSVRLAAESEWSEQHVAVNREFLLQALDAGGAGQLVLELDGPIQPLAVRVPGESRFSILMPVRP
ncbi:MerR family transcriptional regulator [Actinoplanes subtropicus]|uniref:DNA polymerase III subunit beta family protein n=1 Tax=Actinoplanes subtropicus TaxID=543632 RepID=UPI0004C40D06|nr:MerR family transcriptional regulator [Actinoplanes subtropicus]